jgi:hypothetical protein
MYFQIVVHIHAGFEVLTVAIMKNGIFWDVMVCNLVTRQHFGAIFCLDPLGKSGTYWQEIPRKPWHISN